MSQILVVDDEAGIRDLLSEILRDEGHQVRLAQNAAEARQLRTRVRPDLVLLDIWMPDTDGITLLKEWAATGQLTMPVVMMSGHGTIDTAVEATRIGAFAFLEKPIALQKLLNTVGTALRRGGPRTQHAPTLVTVGKSHAVEQLRTQVDRLKTLRTSVLFAAEPGAGADECARQLHPPGTPWVTLESGAGLDAGAAELAGKAADGIVYLRDVQRLAPEHQSMLFAELGALSSASASLPELIAKGSFDARLYAVLAGVIVRVPSLRERAEDVPELANLILTRVIETRESPPRVFTTGALNALRYYHWPGNLVQLETVVKTCVQLAAATEIGVADVTNALATLDAPLPSVAQSLPLDRELRDARDAFERIYFEYHLAREGGNMSRIAARVGLERTHLYRKLKQLGVKLPRRADD
jgi:two-component system, NtrC family, nitrogen regulation response regulator NtrX